MFRAARLADLARWQELADLYLPDGKLLRPSDPGNPIVGRAAILASFQARAPRITLHVLNNIVVEPTSKSTARVSSVVVLYAGSGSCTERPTAGATMLVGHFDDDVSLADGVWAFSSRLGSMALEYEFTLHGHR